MEPSTASDYVPHLGGFVDAGIMDCQRADEEVTATVGVPDWSW
jgi:hypothetical protein